MLTGLWTCLSTGGSCVRRAVGSVRRDGLERAHLLPGLNRLRGHGAVLCALRAAELVPTRWMSSWSATNKYAIHKTGGEPHQGSVPPLPG